jgi:hypothetical protein
MQDQLIRTTDKAILSGGMGLGQESRPERKPSDSSGAAAELRPGSNTGWEVVVGRVVGLADSAEILIELPRSGSGVMKARSVVSISQKEVGQQAVMAFEDGDPAKPIVLGLIVTSEKAGSKVTIGADGDKFVVLAEREIEFRCGEASITLTRAGKVLIKGEYVLTRAKGVNRIKGAAVSIN